MINTPLVDTSLFLLALGSAWFIGKYYYRTRQSDIKLMPLLVLVFLALWCSLNMVAHLVAVWWVNIIRMQAGSFSYTLHFYNLQLMGIVFLSLSLLQLNSIKQMSRGKYYRRKSLTVYCLGLAFLSFPLFPFNPISLLPVISSLIILVVVAATKRQWRRSSALKKQQQLAGVPA